MSSILILMLFFVGISLNTEVLGAGNAQSTQPQGSVVDYEGMTRRSGVRATYDPQPSASADQLSTYKDPVSSTTMQSFLGLQSSLKGKDNIHQYLDASNNQSRQYQQNAGGRSTYRAQPMPYKQYQTQHSNLGSQNAWGAGEQSTAQTRPSAYTGQLMPQKTTYYPANQQLNDGLRQNAWGAGGQSTAQTRPSAYTGQLMPQKTTYYPANQQLNDGSYDNGAVKKPENNYPFKPKQRQ